MRSNRLAIQASRRSDSSGEGSANRSFSNQRLGLAAMLRERAAHSIVSAQQGLEPSPTFVNRAGPLAEPFLHDNRE